MAEFYQSLVCKNNKSIGEEIARLEVVLFTVNKVINTALSCKLEILQLYFYIQNNN